MRKGIKYANSKNISSGDYVDHEDEVPYAEIILCCGFLLVYFMEEIVLAVATKEEVKYVNVIFLAQVHLLVY